MRKTITVKQKATRPVKKNINKLKKVEAEFFLSSTFFILFVIDCRYSPGNVTQVSLQHFVSTFLSRIGQGV